MEIHHGQRHEIESVRRDDLQSQIQREKVHRSFECCCCYLRWSCWCQCLAMVNQKAAQQKEEMRKRWEEAQAMAEYCKIERKSDLLRTTQWQIPQPPQQRKQYRFLPVKAERKQGNTRNLYMSKAGKEFANNKTCELGNSIQFNQQKHVAEHPYCRKRAQ